MYKTSYIKNKRPRKEKTKVAGEIGKGVGESVQCKETGRI